MYVISHTDIPRIRWDIVTVHGGFILSHSVRTYYTNQLFIVFNVQRSVMYPQNVFTLPPKLRGESHSEARVYIVRLFSILTTCGLRHD